MPRSPCGSLYRRRRRLILTTIILVSILLKLVSEYHSSELNNQSQRESEKFPKTILVAACRNQGSTLKIALQSWLSVPGIAELIIVDWGSSIHISEAIPELLQDPRIKLITAEHEQTWILSWAYNLAAKFVPSGSMMLKVDCDTVLSVDFLKSHPMEELVFYADDWRTTANENEKHLNGVFYIKHSYFVEVNGFDERLQIYGNDETDLYDRLNTTGYRMKRLDLTKIYHLKNPDSRRSSREAVRYLNFYLIINRHFKALLPEWNRTSTQTAYYLTVSMKKRGHFFVRRKFRTPSLQAMLPANTVAAIKRRTAHLLIDSSNMSAASLNLTTAYLIKMIPSYGAGKMLIVHAQYSLSSRLRAVASGMAISSKTGRHFRLIWIPDADCPASFGELFSNRLDVWDKFDPVEVTARNFDLYNYMETQPSGVVGRKILTDSENHIYVKTGSILAHDEVTSKSMHEAFSKLQLCSRIATIANTVNVSVLFGLHIRTMNCSEANAQLHDDGCIHTTSWKVPNTSKSEFTDLFTTQIDIILKKDPNQKFFLAADSLSVRSELKERYGKQIWLIDRKTCLHQDKRCVAFAAAKLWILSRTIQIFGSPSSAFSEIAGYIGNKEVKYAGIHFPDIPSDHNTRSKLIGHGNGIIYTAYSSSDNWRVKSEWEWRTAELLKSAQSFHDGLNGEVPISLFTDHQTVINETRMHLFKSVHLVNVSRTSSGRVVKDAFASLPADKQKHIPVSLGKIQQLALSPYEVTLYLDTDTWLCENFTDFTEILGSADIMLAKTAHTHSNSHLAWDSGVILYKNTPVVKRFFRLWEELYVQRCILSGYDSRDTCALAAALDLSPLLRYSSLDPVYNFRLSNENWDNRSQELQQLRSEKVSSPIKILHLNRITPHQSIEACRIVNARRLIPRVLGLTPKNELKMYYSKAECDMGTKTHCDVDSF